ncbi:hypothetical protein HYH03_005908 [Edaphochlamys debaryana]|uniref:ATP citrate synthase n=1 Tax=Edaphochlamys debaryana TaxID=47281 RepID=A0A835YBS7_9CHLO|nr:hypothetical protein HYH03_005908 [Edaphochlamys debaryana]|eukprot:KAG2495980.1 hypothetical protein HYH03_005908 [Edaphochlamys debaryana]
MARKKIREFAAKSLLKAHIKRLAGIDLPIQVAQFTAETNKSDLLNANPWLASTKLVVKPDMLFGQRGKNDLVGLNLDFNQAIDFATARLNREVTINGCTGPISTFLLEPFVPHSEEYYLSITSTRGGWEVAFSEAGGIHIEENWDKLRTVTLDVLEVSPPGKLTSEQVAPLISGLPLEVKPALERFITAAFAVFHDLDMTLLEMNPWTLDASGQPFPLDMRVELDDTALASPPDPSPPPPPPPVRTLGASGQPFPLDMRVELDDTALASPPDPSPPPPPPPVRTLDASGQPFPLDMRVELDDTARYRCAAKWAAGAGPAAQAGPGSSSAPEPSEIEFPLPFGRLLSPAETTIAALDEATGASLKFTVLNPQGRVWLMVAGGGASVIYTDTIADLGFAAELGNYGEYSGAPNTAETYQYARTVLDSATSNTDGRPRALLIGGGIANFTDVAATFTGIIQALKEKAGALQAAKVRIFVRRGGPNWQKGLELMRALGPQIGVPVAVYGPESSMTGICAEAINSLSQA